MNAPKDDQTQEATQLGVNEPHATDDSSASTLAPGSTIFASPMPAPVDNSSTTMVALDLPKGGNSGAIAKVVAGGSTIFMDPLATLAPGGMTVNLDPLATLPPGGMTVNLDPMATLAPGGMTVNQDPMATLAPGGMTVKQDPMATLAPGGMTVNLDPLATLPPGGMTVNQDPLATLPPGGMTVNQDSAATLAPGTVNTNVDSAATLAPTVYSTTKDNKTFVMEADSKTVRTDATKQGGRASFSQLKGGKTEPQAPSLDAKGNRLPVVPGYEILGELGRGGMGVVYRARQQGLGRIVALKMVLNSQASSEELDRFLLEAKAVAIVEHPNIVQIYDVGEYNGLPYFSLEFVAGGPLDALLKGEPQDPVYTATVMAKVCRGIGYAHSKNILHRDLKPANVLMTKTGEPKVTDFGLAKQMDAADEGHTKAGSIMGTPSYMPPEQAEGNAKNLTNLADVYSLGALLYEFITGRPPFKGRTLFETLQHVRTKDPVPPIQLQPSVPLDLQTVCMKALEKSPEKRYPTAEEMAEDLESFLKGDPIKARAVGRVEKAVRWARRNKPQAALIASGVAAVLLIVTGGFVYLGLDAQNQRLRANHIENVNRQILEAEDLLNQSIRSGDVGNWLQSKNEAKQSLAGLDDSEEFEPVRERVEKQIALADAHIETKTRSDQFEAFVDNAFFAATDLTGKNENQNTEDVLEQTAKALELFAIRLEDMTYQPKFSEHFLDEQKKGILEECGALLLLAGSRQLDKDFRDNKALDNALKILDLAKQAGAGEKIRRLYLAQYYQALANRGDRDQQSLADKERTEADKLTPKGSREWFFLGDYLFRGGEFESATKAFSQASRLAPKDFWSIYYQAVSAMRSSSWSEARALLLHCLSTKPTFGFTHVLMGITEGKLKQYPEAFQSFANAVKYLGGETQGVLVNRAAVYYDQGLLKKAEEDLRRAILTDPSNWSAHDNLGMVLRDLKNLAEAETCFRQANQNAKTELLPLRHLAALLGEMDPPKWTESVATFEKVVAREKNPLKVANDLMGLARSKLALGEKETAREILDRALGYDQENALIWLLQGWVINEIAAKKDKVNRTASLPDYKLALEAYNQGFALASKGKADETEAKAMASYFKKVDPESQPEAIEAKLLRARGLIKARLGDYGSAMADYTRSLEINREQPYLRNRRATALISNWREIALEDYSQGIKLNPNDRELYAGRAYVYALLGDHVSAAKDVNIAVGGTTGQVPWFVRVNCAGALAQAYRVAKIPPKGAKPAEQAIQDQYLAGVWSQLTQAKLSAPATVKAGWWMKYIDPDDAFDPVRGLPEWNELSKP